MKFFEKFGVVEDSRQVGAVNWRVLVLVFLALVLLGGAAWLKNAAPNPEIARAPINRENGEKALDEKKSVNNSPKTEKKSKENAAKSSENAKKSGAQNSQEKEAKSENAKKNRSAESAKNITNQASLSQNGVINGDDPENLANTGPGDALALIVGILSFLGFLYLLREYFLTRKIIDEKLLGIR